MDVNLIAPVNSLGYGVVGHNVLKIMMERGLKVAWWPIGPIETVQPHCKDLYQKAIDNQATYNSRAPSLRIWHQFDLALHVGKGVQFALPIFELDSLRPNERHHLMQQDVIFATSSWHKDILYGYCATVDGPRFVTVPLGVDLDIFRCSTKNRADPNWTTFLNCGKWEYRKGHDVLLEAFNKAFTKKDRVRLWMLCHNYFLEPNANKGVDGNKEWQSLYKQSPLGDKIDFLPRVKFHGNVAKIMQEVDCGIFPSRAEGWNLELLEMMACGKQTIATNYSGHTAFINAHNCYPITIDETEEAYDGKWFLGAEQGYGNWAHFGDSQMQQLVDYMRAVHASKQAGEDMINRPGIETANVYTWDYTVDRILSAFEGNV